MIIDNEKIYEKLTSFHSEFTEFRGEVKVRLDGVEKDVDDAKTWENIKLFMILPVTAGLHALASKIGIIKG